MSLRCAPRLHGTAPNEWRPDHSPTCRPRTPTRLGSAQGALRATDLVAAARSGPVCRPEQRPPVRPTRPARRPVIRSRRPAPKRRRCRSRSPGRHPELRCRVQCERRVRRLRRTSGRVSAEHQRGDRCRVGSRSGMAHRPQPQPLAHHRRRTHPPSAVQARCTSPNRHRWQSRWRGRRAMLRLWGHLPPKPLRTCPCQYGQVLLRSGGGRKDLHLLPA